MPTYDQAVQDLTNAATRLGEAAQKYGDARKEQDRAHDDTVEAYEKWRDEAPPSEKTMAALRKAQAEENAAIHDANVAEDALRVAALSFSAAMAEFLSTIAVLSAH